MNTPRKRGARHRQRGFALLVVFLFAAVVAFTLYRQIPRAAFEHARDKEQLLIDRGSQYKRAIEVFYTVNKRYPANIEELEKSTDKRYLRRRYVDPMTGKDEWRVIHTNGTVLTDSLVQKPTVQNAGNGQPGVQGTTPGPLGANNMNTAPSAISSLFSSSAPPPAAAPNGPQAVNPAVLRRPSDRIAAAPGLQPVDPDALANNDAAAFDANALPPITLVTQNPQAQENPQPANPGDQQQGAPGVVNPGAMNVGNVPGGAQPNEPAPQFNPLGGSVNPNLPTPQSALSSAFGQQAGQNQNPQFQGAPPGFVQPQSLQGQLAGQGGFNPQPAFPPNPGAASQNPNLVTIGANGQLVPFASQNSPANGAITPGGQAGGALPPNNANPNAALGLIGQQLRTPTPNVGAQNAIQPNANNLGSPGIAGFASKFEGPSIKSYRERTKYQEWEFVFDPQQSRTNQQNGQAQPQANPGQPNQNRPATATPSQGIQNLFGQPNAAPVFR